MLFNLTEPDQNKPLRGQADDDKKAVLDILKHVASKLDFKDVKRIRVGRFLDSKTRPIKIVLRNADIAKKVLINAKKIKSTNEYAHVSISADRTKKQMEHFSAVKNELDETIAAGEANLRIKYVNDTPRIVALN
nr:unnamed protein product [Callosobruchus analis]CAI5865158.1 unnamed protein product [Callosobruchus analis]